MLMVNGSVLTIDIYIERERERESIERPPCILNICCTYMYIYIFIIISMCVDVLEQFSVLSDTCKPLCTSNHKMLLFGCCFF